MLLQSFPFGIKRIQNLLLFAAKFPIFSDHNPVELGRIWVLRVITGWIVHLNLTCASFLILIFIIAIRLIATLFQSIFLTYLLQFIYKLGLQSCLVGFCILCSLQSLSPHPFIELCLAFLFYPHCFHFMLQSPCLQCAISFIIFEHLIKALLGYFGFVLS